MRVAICDEKPKYQNMIRRHLRNYCISKELDCDIDMYSTGSQLVNTQHQKYDMIFLDITIPGLDGIEIARMIRNDNSNVIIVFVTSHIEYATYGYEVNAFRYILKEQLAEEFYITMDDIINQLQSNKKRIYCKFIEGDAALSLKDLIYIKSEKHKLYYNVIVNSYQRFSVYQKLDEAEKQINDSSLLRIHKRFLVNMNYIRSINRYYAELLNGEKFPITKDKYPDVIKKYLLFKG